MKRRECNGSRLMDIGFEPLYKYGPEAMDLWSIANRIRQGAKVELEKSESGLEALKIEMAGYMQTVAVRRPRIANN